MQNYTGVSAVSGGGGGIVAAPIVSAVNGVSFVDWSIPAAVRRITLDCDQVLMGIGSIAYLGTASGLVTSGYGSISAYLGSFTSYRMFSDTGLLLPETTVSNCTSRIVFDRVSDFSWACTGQSLYNSNFLSFVSGRALLPGVLTTFRVQPSGGFSAGGSMQLLWEF